MSAPRSSGSPAGRVVPALDGVRGLAIAAVLGFHFNFPFRPLPNSWIGDVVARGWMGVDLFFVLSGFLITGILLDTRASSNYFSSFYARRFLRIFPLYYLTLAVWFGLLPLVVRDSGFVGREQQAWYWTYLANWGWPLGHDVSWLSHLWSLAIEEQFYLVWPLLVWLAGPRRLVGICLALVLLAPAVRTQLVLAGHPMELAHRFTHARVDTLALGALMALAARDERLAAIWRRLRLPVWALIVAAAAVSNGFYFDHPLTLTLGYSAIALASASLVFETGTRDGGWRRVLVWRPLRSLGKYSYGIYVIHFPISFAAWQGLKDYPWYHTTSFGIAYVLAGSAVSYALAWLVWHAYERRFLALKDRFAARAEAPATAVAG